MTRLMIIWPVTMHLLAKLSICLGKSNLARQSYYTLSMEKSLSWLKTINVQTICSPHHKNCYDRTNTKNWWCFCASIADFPSLVTYTLVLVMAFNPITHKSQKTGPDMHASLRTLIWWIGKKLHSISFEIAEIIGHSYVTGCNC